VGYSEMMLRMLIAALAILSASCLTAAQEQSNNESIPFPLRPALATQQLQGVSEDSETCSLPEARSRLEEAVEQFCKRKLWMEYAVTITSLEHLSIVLLQTAVKSSVQVKFLASLATIGSLHAGNGSTIQVYCALSLSSSHMLLLKSITWKTTSAP